METLRVTTSSGSATKLSSLESQIPAGAFQGHRQAAGRRHIGSEIQQSAIVASLLSMFGILVYVAFRYEFSFAVAAVVAVLHDVLLAIGCYCIANGHFRARVQRHGRRGGADHHRFFHQRQNRHLRPHPRRLEARRARLVQGQSSIRRSTKL
jgi:hypothetical protein